MFTPKVALGQYVRPRRQRYSPDLTRLYARSSAVWNARSWRGVPALWSETIAGRLVVPEVVTVSLPGDTPARRPSHDHSLRHVGAGGAPAVARCATGYQPT